MPEPESVPSVEEPDVNPPIPERVSEQLHETMTPAKTKKKPILLIGASVLLLVIGLLLMWPVYGPWSEWSEQKIGEAENIKVESMNEYRFRNAVVLEANADSLPVDAEVIGQKEVWSEYSDWSTWQEEPVTADETCQVESQIMYSSRKKTVTEEWSDWSSWSDWSTNEASETDSRQVKNRIVYYYEGARYRCTNCGSVFGEFTMGMVSHAHGLHNVEVSGPNYSGGNLTQADIDNLYNLFRGRPAEGKSRDEILKDAGYIYETKKVTSINEELSLEIFDESDGIYKYDNWYFFSSTYSKQEKQYSTRSRSKVSKETWSDWSEYVLEAPPETADTEVKTQNTYRYRTREMETLYLYRSWGEWSDWSTEIPNTSTETDSEQRVVYRYAEQLPLWKLLFGK